MYVSLFRFSCLLNRHAPTRVVAPYIGSSLRCHQNSTNERYKYQPPNAPESHFTLASNQIKSKTQTKSTKTTTNLENVFFTLYQQQQHQQQQQPIDCLFALQEQANARARRSSVATLADTRSHPTCAQAFAQAATTAIRRVMHCTLRHF